MPGARRETNRRAARARRLEEGKSGTNLLHFGKAFGVRRLRLTCLSVDLPETISVAHKFDTVKISVPFLGFQLFNRRCCQVLKWTV